MDRRAFLALLSTPALVPLLQSCGDHDASDGHGFRFLSSSQSRASGTETDALAGARAMNRFASDLYSHLATTGEPNLVFSPMSVLMALAMTRAGAVGRTAAEMDTVLHATEEAPNIDAFHRAINSLAAVVESRNGVFEDSRSKKLHVDVSMANSLWGQEGFEWKTPFLDVLAREYGAGLRVVDFMTRTEDARIAINSWVKSETTGRIPELLKGGVLTSDVRLVLVNAIRMKAPWLVAFPEGSTIREPFTLIDGSGADVPMMRSNMRCGFASGDGWQAVDLAYVSRNLAMTLIVPDAGAFTDVESMVQAGLLNDVVEALDERDVTLSVPRFAVETKADLRPALRALGMRAVFDPSAADLSAMTADAEMYVDFVVHQANITVDEKGTEAAAATAVGAGTTSAPTEPVTLDIDRPFIHAVRDVPTGALLFLGRVGDPR